MPRSARGSKHPAIFVLLLLKIPNTNRGRSYNVKLCSHAGCISNKIEITITEDVAGGPWLMNIVFAMVSLLKQAKSLDLARSWRGKNTSRQSSETSDVSRCLRRWKASPKSAPNSGTRKRHIRLKWPSRDGASLMSYVAHTSWNYTYILVTLGLSNFQPQTTDLPILWLKTRISEPIGEPVD